MAGASLFKPTRDIKLVAASLLNAPAFWILCPHPTLRSLLVIAATGCILAIVIYAYNRLTEVGARAAAGSHKLLLAGLFAAFFPCVAWLPNTTARVAAVACMVSGFVYSFRFGGADGDGFQIKKLYGVKPVLVAGAHAVQWIAFTGRTDTLVLILIAWHFFDMLAMTSLMDMPDLREDKRAGVKTFVVVHGIKRTLELIFVFSALSIAAGVAVVLITGAWPLALFLFPRALAKARLVVRLRRGKKASAVDSVWMRALGVAGIALYWLLG